MAIQTKKKYSGQQSTSVLSGSIRLEEGNNRMVISKGDVETVVMNENGLNIGPDQVVLTGDGLNIGDNIISGKYRTSPDRYGTIYYVDGVPRILMGEAPSNGRMGVWVSKPGVNVLTGL